MWRKNRMRKAVLSVCVGMLVALLCVGCNGKSGKVNTKESKKPAESSEKQEEVSPYFVYEIDQEKKYTTITSYLNETEENIVIPEYFEYDGEKYPVTTIAEEAFYYNTAVKHITIPETVTTIGKEAFCKCEALESVDIPGSAVTLGTGVFYDCTSLETVTIGEGIVNIPDEFFTNCYAMKEIKLPETLTAIGAEAFWACENLTELELPKSLVSIGERSLYSSGIKTLKVMSPSATITENTLDGVEELKEIYVPEGLVDIVSGYVDEEDVKVKALE